MSEQMAAYPRCATCTWWEKYEGTDEGSCELTEVRYSEMIHPESLARSEGIDNLELELVTKPDFGCIQHSPKDDT